MDNFWKKLAKVNEPFLVLAPMDGVTDYVFREIVTETAKPDVLFTEFTNVEGLASKGREKIIFRLKYSKKQHYIVAQIWGTEPKNFYAAAKLIKELGFDGIDINMGCPVREVMRIGCGAAHMKNHNLATEIIKATQEGAEGLPVSVKTRLGVKPDINENWMTLLLKLKIDALTVHGRTAPELSKVPARWEEIGKIVKMRDEINPETVIIGNGDIESRQQANEMKIKHNVDGVMIGRGIFSNPWIFEKKPKIHDHQEALKLLIKHTKLFLKYYPDEHYFPVMRKYYKIYVREFFGADNLKKQLMESRNFDEVKLLISNLVK